jgi:NAD(P)-dependent dehydrogenase (short-subunit alcohol dehydrogenase family)
VGDQLETSPWTPGRASRSRLATDLFDFAGRCALVTGGATGIGREIALLLASLGADVAIANLGDGLDETGEAIRAYGRRTHLVAVDVTDAEQCRRMVDDTVEAFGSLDTLVNCAGASISHRYDEWTPQEWDQLLALNVRAAFFASQAAIPHMVRRGGGVIVNIASIASVSPVPAVLPYGTAKAGLVNLTMTLGAEVAPLGVRINAVAPGTVKSGRMLQLLEASGRDPDEVGGDNAALGRPAERAEIAWPVAFLVSDASSYLVGQTLHVNGGTPARIPGSPSS